MTSNLLYRGTRLITRSRFNIPHHIPPKHTYHAFHTSRRRARDDSKRSFPALFARGGTSNGLIIHRHHLPPQDQWHTVLPAAMGSPDPYGRQLNGMGSGVSSTSKICVLAPTTRPDADVEFTFVQVGIRDGGLDMAGNCGNMLSAVGPASLELGLLSGSPRIETDAGTGNRTAVVRIFNTNTAKVIRSSFNVEGNPPRYRTQGDYAMDGVPGTGSRITLAFLNPAGAKTGRALPTGNIVDKLALEDGSTIEASLVDVSGPGVFVRAADLVGSMDGAETLTPAIVEADSRLKARLEMVRRAGAASMGLDPEVQSVPKIVLILPLGSEAGIDVRCLALSMGQAHKAVPLTLALCLGAAAGMPGTIPFMLRARGGGVGGRVVVGHPSGRVEVGTTVEDGEIQSAELDRTARILMKGDVFY